MEVLCGKHHTLATLPMGKNPGAYWIGGWVGRRAGLHDLEKINFLSVLGFEPWIVQPLA